MALMTWRTDPPVRLPAAFLVVCEDPHFGVSWDRREQVRRCPYCQHTATAPIGVRAHTEAHWCSVRAPQRTLIVWESR